MLTAVYELGKDCVVTGTEQCSQYVPFTSVYSKLMEGGHFG